MKIYTVVRGTSGQVGCTVKVERGNPAHGGSPAYLLPHCVLHSPTGFETGYSGSGPADLAVSILADYLGARPERVTQVWQKAWPAGPEEKDPALIAIRRHQAFKEKFIAPRTLEPGKSYEILGAEIASWLADFAKEHHAQK